MKCRECGKDAELDRQGYCSSAICQFAASGYREAQRHVATILGCTTKTCFPTDFSKESQLERWIAGIPEPPREYGRVIVYDPLRPENMMQRLSDELWNAVRREG